MGNVWACCHSVGFVITSAIAFSANCAIAQIIPDATLPNNSQVTPPDKNNVITIEGGTKIGSNLFHSFKEFSVLDKTTAEFNNTDVGVQNIISRVTGKFVSNIEGIIKAQANLFLINPNGIIFGPNASLQIGGSFVASTASSLNFGDGTKFSATDAQTTPLLTLSVPIGLQFGATAAPIRNQSQSQVNPNGERNPVGLGLQVQPDKTLALVGGDITLEGGNLTAASGRIELGSVGANSLVSLNPTNQGWVLRYQGVQNFQNIQLTGRTINSSNIPSRVIATNKDGNGGTIQVQGNSVELIGDRVLLSTQTTGASNGGDLNISSSKLIVRGGAQIATSTRGQGDGGKLTVNASKSVEIIGSSLSPDGSTASSLFSSTAVAGKAGEIIINTGSLLIQDGGKIATDSIANSQLIPGTGAGGDLTVNASKSVEIIGTSSGLFASTNTSGDAGSVKITTGKLIIQDGAKVTVSSEFKNYNYPENVPTLGKAGDLNITSSSISLDNQASLTSDSESGRGGNITLDVQDILMMRHGSKITTNAQGDGDGGNITINAPNGFLVTTPSENNDIIANALSASGGRITITAKSIFGFVPRTRAEVERLLNPKEPLDPSRLLTSDITAFSQQNPTLNGTVQINSPDADPSKGLVELPVNLVDASQQIAAGCDSGGKIARSSFIATGRGGIVADPTQPLISDDAVLADWIALSPESQNLAGGIQKRVAVKAQRDTEEKSQKVNSVNEPNEIVEAQGWVMDANGNVVLVAQVPTASPHNSALTATSCAAN
ncbi:MAG: filamentous hemagglutinin N-terminal domain-containing protein [Nostoc desertorum CM1-VF14]|nr:filamentous hemagglutinin N-terminal domain-containing protein [Nostoc desertorum CM1-VF14]